MKLNKTATLTSCTVGASLMLGASLLMLPKAQGAQEQCSGKQTSVRYKTSIQREALNGTYTLDADCTGTLTLEGQLGGPAHWDVFVTSDGKKGRMIRTDAGTSGVRTFEQ